MKPQKILSIVKFLSIIGIGLALYLLFEQFTNSLIRPCNINATINCDAIISGAVSKTLGIPTPLIGLIGYIVILLSAWFKKIKLMLAMSTFGLLFCLSIAYIEIFKLNVICPVCILCQLDMIIVFILALILSKKPTK